MSWGFKVQALGFRVECSGCPVRGCMLRTSGSSFRDIVSSIGLCLQYVVLILRCQKLTSVFRKDRVTISHLATSEIFQAWFRGGGGGCFLQDICRQLILMCWLKLSYPHKSENCVLKVAGAKGHVNCSIHTSL